MAFGQQSGPPATHRQIAELLELLESAGHSDFRDARGPMGFTQRQANGKFTRGEADAFIESLQAAGEAVDGAAGPADRDTFTVTKRPVATDTGDQQLGRYSDRQLAAELQRRGWIVVEP